jgi:ABC-type antimicrobial peptide transport system permease subunit
VPLPQITFVKDRLANRLAPRRFQIETTSLFALIGVLLSTVGLYASLSYHVTLRTREIGIRSALGADRRRIVGWIVGKALRLASLGVLAGLIAATLAARIIQSVLYQTNALDPAIYAGTTAVVLFIALAASLPPALRGARISPTRALRQE